MRVLVTGAAGFIGFHVCQKLLKSGVHVSGVDSLNTYYDVNLKKDRLAQLSLHETFSFEQFDIAQANSLEAFFERTKPDCVIHLAAQAGVRYSLENPSVYVQANLVGFANMLECCRHHSVDHLVYASSSSVYGANKKLPFSVEDPVDHPVSLYAATKKSNELMAHAYSHLFDLPTTGLRFFTVYGPWGRPDMAIFKFTQAILRAQPIEVYNHGHMQRDFTYIDDIVEGVIRVLHNPPKCNDDQSAEASAPTHSSQYPAHSPTSAPYHLYNIGNHSAVELLYLIETLEDLLGKKAEKILLPIQPGDVPATYADVTSLNTDVGFQPNTPIETGLKYFVDWYRSYYQI